MNASRPIYVLTLILTAGLLLAVAPVRAETPLVEVLKANPEWVGTVDETYSLAVTFRVSDNLTKLENVSYRWERGEKRNATKFKLGDATIEFLIPPERRNRWYDLTLTKDGTLKGSLTGILRDGSGTFDMSVFLRPVDAEEARAAWVVEPREGETKLTPDEVRATFIATPWHGPSGAFIFRMDGTYTYKNFNASEPRGTWSYRMKDDGTLEGATTSYTFYKNADGYRYFHSRSNRFYPATPNMSPFL